MIPLVQIVVGVSVVFAPCPAYLPVQVSCYEPSTRTIYVKPTSLSPKFSLMHEYGHAWDIERLNDAQRDHFKQTLGYSAAHPWWGAGIGRDTMAPGEAFANAYADCALGLKRRNPKVCAMLPRSALGTWVKRVRLLTKH